MSIKQVRGIDHVGITVPNINEATDFFSKAFDSQIIYCSYTADQPPLGGKDLESKFDLERGAELIACRMISLGAGPTIELFEIRANKHQQPARPSDYGMQHLAIYTDDILQSIERVKGAGGRALSSPQPLMFPVESGKGNVFCYCKAPWGTFIELISYPSKMNYEDHTELRLWHAKD